MTSINSEGADMNVEQQNKAVGKLVDEMLGIPVGLTHALRRTVMCGAIHKFLATQNTGEMGDDEIEMIADKVHADNWGQPAGYLCRLTARAVRDAVLKSKEGKV